MEFPSKTCFRFRWSCSLVLQKESSSRRGCPLPVYRRPWEPPGLELVRFFPSGSPGKSTRPGRVRREHLPSSGDQSWRASCNSPSVRQFRDRLAVVPRLRATRWASIRRSRYHWQNEHCTSRWLSLPSRTTQTLQTSRTVSPARCRVRDSRDSRQCTCPSSSAYLCRRPIRTSLALPVCLSGSAVIAGSRLLSLPLRRSAWK
mmetsp:Transcript_69990/g.152223  ORF Transcript_69990/g.152223 Transcript_69990/m.152223 type:complete len:202 (-) Transcript_69990:144-749(-)